MFTHYITDDLRKFTNERIVVLLMNIIFVHPDASNKVDMIFRCMDLYHNYISSQIQDRHIILCQLLVIIHSAVLSLKGIHIQTTLIISIFQMVELHF